MPILKDYNEFAGRTWETGTVRNALAYQGVKAPHTGEAVSEALLLGASGGIALGYFTFHYEGYEPHIAILTRNTFDPTETMFDRLAIPREVVHTSNAQKGLDNLLEALEGGRPAIVTADMCTLPYNGLPYDKHNWGMLPILVYGIEDETAYIADRSSKPFMIPTDVLQAARARIKKDKFRVTTLDTPNFSRLESAVQKGIWQCISLYTDAPPKGKRDNFGFAAYKYWAKMLTNTRNKNSWERYFPPGSKMMMALAGDRVQPGAFSWIQTWTGDGAERGLYAEFLDESATILGKSDLKTVATQFRNSQQEWCKLADMLLPDSVALLQETRNLLQKKRALFIEQGPGGLKEIETINQRLAAIFKEASQQFPMSAAEVTDFRAGLADQILVIHDIEEAAINDLQVAMR